MISMSVIVAENTVSSMLSCNFCCFSLDSKLNFALKNSEVFAIGLLLIPASVLSDSVLILQLLSLQFLCKIVSDGVDTVSSLFATP